MVTVKNIYKMLIDGSNNLYLNNKRDYMRSVSDSVKEATDKRWIALGYRLRLSADKIMHNGV